MSTHRMLTTLALALALALGVLAAAPAAAQFRFELAEGALAIDAELELKFGLAGGQDGALALVRGESVVDRAVFGGAQLFVDAEMIDGDAAVIGIDGGDVLVVTIDPRALALTSRCPGGALRIDLGGNESARDGVVVGRTLFIVGQRDGVALIIAVALDTCTLDQAFDGDGWKTWSRPGEGAGFEAVTAGTPGGAPALYAAGRAGTDAVVGSYDLGGAARTGFGMNGFVFVDGGAGMADLFRGLTIDPGDTRVFAGGETVGTGVDVLGGCWDWTDGAAECYLPQGWATNDPFGAAERVWDLHYDAARDRVFVAGDAAGHPMAGIYDDEGLPVCMPHFSQPLGARAGGAFDVFGGFDDEPGFAGGLDDLGPDFVYEALNFLIDDDCSIDEEWGDGGDGLTFGWLGARPLTFPVNGGTPGGGGPSGTAPIVSAPVMPGSFASSNAELVRRLKVALDSLTGRLNPRGLVTTYTLPSLDGLPTAYRVSTNVDVQRCNRTFGRCAGADRSFRFPTRFVFQRRRRPRVHRVTGRVTVPAGAIRRARLRIRRRKGAHVPRYVRVRLRTTLTATPQGRAAIRATTTKRLRLRRR